MLSGYLFSKILDGKEIAFVPFFINRALRLLPLLLLTLTLLGFQKYLAGEDIFQYIKRVCMGLVFPTLPHGGWSITVESHFYLMLPLLLAVLSKHPRVGLIFLAAAIAVRGMLYLHGFETRFWAYWTIVGRVDQFLCGMMLFQFRYLLTRRHTTVALIMLAFTIFYWLFDAAGGYNRMGDPPAANPLWIIIPTIEGAAYASIIAWYDTSFSFRSTGFSRLLGLAGELSYSMYLLHFFTVFATARFIQTHVMDISNFYIASLWALAFYIAMLPIVYVSYRFVEMPFLKLRRRYTIQRHERDTATT